MFGIPLLFSLGWIANPDQRRHVDGYELHMNTMGWKISDEHYSLWKANVGERFKAPQEKKAVAGKLKGEMGLRSTAVYCRTIFWELTK